MQVKGTEYPISQYAIDSELDREAKYVPLVGNPIAALHMIADPKTRRLGCGSAMPCPTCATKGRIINAATV